MSLILTFRNTQKEPGPLTENAGYDVRVLVGDGGSTSHITITTGRVEGHKRSAGWIALVRKFLDEYEAGTIGNIRRTL